MKLTKAEKDFASRHHELVTEYLKRRRLSENDFYDVVVFRYLKAVQNYLSNETLRQYAFQTIAFRAMDSAVNNHFKSMRTQTRTAIVLSLDYPVNYSGTLTFQDILADNDCDVFETVCAKLDTNDVMRTLNKLNRDILSMKTSGYSNREIAKKYEATVTDIDRCFRDLADSICDFQTAA